MNRGRLLARALFGGGLDRRVAPIVPVSFTYSASFSTFWVYVGIYAVKGLHWPASRVGLLFLASAPAAAVANYLSGRISDRTGRKPLIVASFLASSANVLLLTWLGGTTALAFVLIVVQGVIGAPAYSLDRVLVADLVHDDESREPAYASVRVATNLGTLVGPPLGALLVFVAGWTAFLLGIAVLGVVGAAFAIALLPPAHAIAEAREPGSLRAVVRNRPFSLLLLSTLLAFTDYCGFETVLPVLAVSAYGLAPSTWGLLVIISPALVVLAQLRLTRASSRIPPASRLAGATLLMGLPFLALLASNHVAVIAAVIVVFVIGEMVWMPTSQAVAAQLAPPHARGTYFGALAAMTGPAWTLAPFVAFQLRAHAGVGSVWLLFAAIAVASAAAGAAAVGAVRR
ncbi:MAG: MFS transporter [Actinobacteria bacterium]|nr:MAG: MFS transporter [Actinomycetota bacterium]